MKSTTRDTIRIYFSHMMAHPWVMLITVLSVISAVLLDTYRPVLYKQFFDVLAANDTSSVSQLTKILVIILIINLVMWAAWRISSVSAIYSASRVMTNILNTCFNYIHGHSYDFFNNNFVGSLSRKITRYSKAYDDISDRILWDLGPTIISMIVIIAVLYTRQPLLAYIIFGWTVFYTAVNYWFVAYKMQFDLARVEADTKASGYLADTIGNHLNVKLFSAKTQEYNAFFKLTDTLRKWRSFTWHLDVVSQAVQGLLMVLLEFGIMYYATKLWQQGILTIGDFALIQAYLLKMFQSLWSVGKYLHRIFESLADAQEMTEILTTPHGVQDAANAKKITVQKGEIAFDDVKFGYYDAKPVMHNFNLEIKAGEKIAFVGPSGGGKTTITKLLLRFFDIQNGKILIDGQNIAEVTMDSLRASIAVVPQEPILFHRKLSENIGYGNPKASMKEIEEAAKQAHCHEFIMQLPDKYQTFVGERGVKLSGGERQRVAIARAILKNAPILVLDEATSSLDSESEMLIQDALKGLMKGKTTIVIAHRLSTIMQMDRIIVLENGRILEEGQHAELVKAQQGTYQKLWNIQAGGFVE